jgi:hypothetical protein
MFLLVKMNGFVQQSSSVGGNEKTLFERYAVCGLGATLRK